MDNVYINTKQMSFYEQLVTLRIDSFSKLVEFNQLDTKIIKKITLSQQLLWAVKIEIR